MSKGLRGLAKLIKNITEEKTPEQEFMYILNEVIQRSEVPRQPSKTYKPSSLGGCMRMNFFQVSGYPVDQRNPTEPNMIGIQESGTDRHERLQNYIAKAKEMGHDLEWIDVGEFLKRRPVIGTKVVEQKGMETKLRNDVLNLSFMCDGIFKLNGKYMILEIKTETSFKWQGRSGPEEKHVVQASAYSTALGVDLVMFVYENRDNCSKKTFMVKVTDEERFERVIHYIETCEDFRERKEVPSKSTKKSDCRYCKFTEECKKY